MTMALLAVLLFQAADPVQSLHVYGPGGPSAPIRRCADLYTAAAHVPVLVTAGPEEQLFAAARVDADLVYGGSEYMLTQFGLDHPGFLLPGTRAELGSRAAGILVRPGNPRHIGSLVDLARPGLRLLDVNGAGQLGLWEDLAGRLGLIDRLQHNIARSVPSSAEAVKEWDGDPGLDAWITYESWHNRLPRKTELIRLPAAERLYRGTPIAITAGSTHRAQAEAFLAELQSGACHKRFQDAGWR